MKRSIKSPARQALAATIRHREEAEQKLQSAQGVLDRGQAHLCDLYGKMSQFDTLDQEIADAKANAVRIALERGEIPPLDKQPDGFASKLIARDHVKSDLDAMQATIKILEQDVAIAKQHVEQCKLDIEWAAESVFAEEAESLASSYIEQLSELRATAYLLNAMSMRQVHKQSSEIGGDRNPNLSHPQTPHLAISFEMRRVSMPAVVHEALEENVVGSFERKFGFHLRSKMSALAISHWGELQKNPNAQLKIESDSKSTPAAARKVTVAAMKSQLADSEIELTP